MGKTPAEVFGYLASDRSTEAQSARELYWCPFVNQRCNKQSRLVDYPMGVCSVYFNDQIIAICPRRFLQARKALQDVADARFGTRSDLIVFSEIGLPTIGTFDYVMVKHRPLSAEIEDFVIVEFQTGQTTGTGKLVEALKDVMNGVDIAGRSYGFGLNLYDIWKRSFTQILNKGIVMEAWGKKIYWVVQEQVIGYLLSRYHLDTLVYDDCDTTIFLTYDLVTTSGQTELRHSHLRSSSVDALFSAFRNNPKIPTREEFEATLVSKLRASIGFTLS